MTKQETISHLYQWLNKISEDNLKYKKELTDILSKEQGKILTINPDAISEEDKKKWKENMNNQGIMWYEEPNTEFLTKGHLISEGYKVINETWFSGEHAAITISPNDKDYYDQFIINSHYLPSERDEIYRGKIPTIQQWEVLKDLLNLG